MYHLYFNLIIYKKNAMSSFSIFRTYSRVYYIYEVRRKKCFWILQLNSILGGNIMRWHRNLLKEFNGMISAYAEIDRDYIFIDVTYIEQNRKKAKFNRLLSCIKYFVTHTSEFKVILADVPWNVPYVSFGHVSKDLEAVVEHMCQNSGASYLIKVRDEHERSVRFVATKTLDPNEIRSTIITNFSLEKYEMVLGRCYSRKKYWQ